MQRSIRRGLKRKEPGADEGSDAYQVTIFKTCVLMISEYGVTQLNWDCQIRIRYNMTLNLPTPTYFQKLNKLSSGRPHAVPGCSQEAGIHATEASNGSRARHP